MRTLSLGAIDYVSKPKLDVSNGTIEQSADIIAKVKAAAKVKVRGGKALVMAPVELAAGCHFSATHKVLVIGSSTGGTEALKELLSPLPADFPGLVMVQHMPEAFTRPFSETLGFMPAHPTALSRHKFSHFENLT